MQKCPLSGFPLAPLAPRRGFHPSPAADVSVPSGTPALPHASPAAALCTGRAINFYSHRSPRHSIKLDRTAGRSFLICLSYRRLAALNIYRARDEVDEMGDEEGRGGKGQECGGTGNDGVIGTARI